MPTSAPPAIRASLAERLSAVRDHPPSVLHELLDVRIDRTRLDDGDPIHVVRPKDWPALRAAEQDFGPDVPYWAVQWPSGLSLARWVAANPPAPGTRVLELGCGLALPSLAAARAGARVVATDANVDAAVFAAHNLAINEVEGDVVPGDWREVTKSLVGDPFPLVLAADVLYLKEMVESLLELLPRLVAPGGEIVIADPGRSGTEDFVPMAKRLFHLTREPAADERITLFRLRPR